MESGIWGFIGVVAVAFIVAVTSIGTTAWIAWNASRAKTREFQRDNLMQLQETLLEQMMFILKHRTETGGGEAYLDNPVSKEFIKSTQILSFLIERTADESLRETMWHVTKEMNSSLLAYAPLDPSDDSSDGAMKIMVAATNEAWVKIGVVLRSNY